MLKTYFNQFVEEFWINFNTFLDYESFASEQKKIVWMKNEKVSVENE